MMIKYDREMTDLRENYENQVVLCRQEMQHEFDRLTTKYQQMSDDEQKRSQTKLQLREQVRVKMIDRIDQRSSLSL